jgi:hypothetical protein
MQSLIQEVVFTFVLAFVLLEEILRLLEHELMEDYC